MGFSRFTIVPLLVVVCLPVILCQEPIGKLECYIEDGMLKFDILVLRNGIGFTSIYFTDSDRTQLDDTDCPPIVTIDDVEFSASLYVDPTTNLLVDGRSCGIDVIQQNKEYRFRIETEIEPERERKGDIRFIFNCDADFAAMDVVSMMYFIRDPDIVTPNVPTEDLHLSAVTTTGGQLPTTTLGDGTQIPTIVIGEYFALELFFETTSDSSAKGATCKKLYVSVDDTFDTTTTDDIISPDTGCPVNQFLSPATGLVLAATPAANSYRYRTGAIQAARYDKLDVPSATDTVIFACEAEFCDQQGDLYCDNRCQSSGTPGKKKRAVQYVKRSEFKKLVKRRSDDLVTLQIRVTDKDKRPSPSAGVSMAVIWSLVGIACAVLIILVIFLMVFCRARSRNRMRSNAYIHHVDQNSLSSEKKIRY